MMIWMFGTPNVHVEYEDSYYDEAMLQDYADEQYAKAFSDSSAYEDNLLIVFLTNEDNYSFNYIAWVGDHIATDINYMMGNNDTELGWEMASCINESNYKYSLDANLAAVMTAMAKRIEMLGLDSSYTCTEDHAQVNSHLINYTDLPMTDSTVNDALEYFTDTTGIPVVIVVEDMEDVFGSSEAPSQSSSSGGGMSVLLVVVVTALVIVLVYSLRRRRKADDDEFSQDNRNKKYSQFDDHYK